MSRITNEFHAIEFMTAAYLETAAWADSEAEVGAFVEFTKSAQIQARKECVAFLEQAMDHGIGSDLAPAVMGHNFWLSRNGHGTGFIDSDSRHAVALQALAAAAGTRELEFSRGKLRFF